MKRWLIAEKVLLGAFFFWSVAGLIFTLGHLTPEAVAAWRAPTWLRDFVGGCVRTGDPILILLAFANTHLHAARQWTPPLARRWALIVLVAAVAVETLGVSTGFPFGAYRYTDRLGPLIGLVPLTIPLAWHVVVTNALFLVRAVLPQSSRLLQAALSGLICMAYDAVLEPFATTAKHYWIWSAGTIPPQNYAAWFVLSAALVYVFAPRAATRDARDPRPFVILAVMLLIFVAGTWSS